MLCIAKPRQGVTAGLLMEDPAALEAEAKQLEDEADELEQAGRSVAGHGRLQQAKSLRDQATLLRNLRQQGRIFTSSISS